MSELGAPFILSCATSKQIGYSTTTSTHCTLKIYTYVCVYKYIYERERKRQTLTSVGVCMRIILERNSYLRFSLFKDRNAYYTWLLCIYE